MQDQASTPVDSDKGSLDETRATAFPIREDEGPPLVDQTPVDQTRTGRRRAPTWLLLSIVGTITLLVIAAMSAYGGYTSGVYERKQLALTQSAGQYYVQLEMAALDMIEGRYEMARQRLEWLVSQDPNYPGATDLLAEVYLVLNTTATPTVMPTPTLTPTPDLRTVEELFTQGRTALAAGEWDTAIETLLKVRKNKADFHAIEIDGMLFVALRNRGLDKIKNAELEGGTYDLALAERFGPLDNEAKNYRDWAELYITGASFWEIDWSQAINYFSQLSVTAPYLRDASGWTSLERYRRALVGYGDSLALQERWCESQEQYQLALDMSPDPEIEPTATFAADECASGGDDDQRDSLEGTASAPGEVDVTPGSTPLPWELTPQPVRPDPTAGTSTPAPSRP